MSLKEKILNLVNSHNHISFAEISNIPGASGEYAIGMDDYNIVYWNNVSKETIDACADLLNEGLVKLVPTGKLTYLVDGCILSLPLAKSCRKYKSLRWMPMVLSKP